MPRHEKYYPSKALSPFIQYYFFPEIDRLSVLRDHQDGFKVLPSTHVRLVLFLSGGPTFRWDGEKKVFTKPFILNGFLMRPKTLFGSSPFRQMMVGFTPIGAQQFLDFPLAELTNADLSVNEVFPSDYEQLVYQIRSAETNQNRVRILERFFLKKLQSQKPLDRRIQPVLDYIIRQKGGKTLKEVSGEVALGERTLQRLIHNHVGINFKSFSRLVRFQAARAMLVEANDLSLTDIGLQLGFYDQAHFIHEFTGMSGRSPGDFRGEERSKVGTFFDTVHRKDRQVII